MSIGVFTVSVVEVRVTASNMHMQIYGTESIHLHNFARDTVDTIPFLAQGFDDCPTIHGNVARLYEAIAADVVDYCTFEQALGTHHLIGEMYAQNGARY